MGHYDDILRRRVMGWRCWALHRREPGVLASKLDPNPGAVEWAPGPFWQRRAWCAFHGHFAPDDSEKCGRCGWRGEPDLGTLIWWLDSFKRVTPDVVGRVELGGVILQGDPKHPEIPNIRRAEQIRVAGPLIVAPVDGAGDHVRALAGRYHVDDVRLSSAGDMWSWLRKVPADLAAPNLANADGYWHGGAPGLDVGDWLLPRSGNGTFRPYDVMAPLAAAGLVSADLAAAAQKVNSNPGCVYLTTSRAQAQQYAHGYSAWLTAIGAPGTGTLYRAEPSPPAVRDPTVPGAIAAPRARITAVEGTAAAPDNNMRQATIAMMRARYLQWREECNGGADPW